MNLNVELIVIFLIPGIFTVASTKFKLAIAIRIRSPTFFVFVTGAHELQSFGLAGTARKRAKRGYKATTASNWVKVKPLRAKSAAQIVDFFFFVETVHHIAPNSCSP
ncbi:BZ3500_MvSof-1268-A1-R1_Chr2-2g04774 [Microbotryum saponariae]|uniref:BZ3500_MvSof-1268-A1-R1_Chr2-2g04774 protein n=1 Tax=Microbotryum saponariae TaxID=289078 RepID=A0A2X0K7R0_9BASI|nr:BZ3500_MvSof-1268-A1-R1_Chr2-2g04774 [Microbotryum saponariae]SDA00138.1 BZ3501_MvSof-1269-A2-R1_Chr2-2g04448 [Microbotryum saponariae]